MSKIFATFFLLFLVSLVSGQVDTEDWLNYYITAAKEGSSGKVEGLFGSPNAGSVPLVPNNSYASNMTYIRNQHQQYLNRIMGQYACVENLMPFSQGHKNLSEITWEPFLEENPRALVVVSMKNCLACCYIEKFLNSIQKIASNEMFWNQSQPLVIGRIDLSKDIWFNTEHRSERIPYILFY